MTGKVYLIGAGPGDPGLLTRKGAEVLASAEVVVYDRLVGREILAMMPRSAELINVGKHAGNHPVPQEQISQILLDKALEGKRVVRLKGGDCFLFGRGGEELEPLFAHGVPFEVVPGVPSPIAATAYAGIPVTHRDYCSSVHFITGHKKKDGALDLDYEALIRLDGTLVFLMSIGNCAEIAEGLLSHGMDPAMPCAVVENGTRLDQRKFTAPLRGLVDCVRDNGVISPALIIVGRVCTLSERFDWFDALPLHGLRVLLTSTAGSASRLKARLDAWGADVTALPAIEPRPLPFALPELDRYELIAFSSAAGVRFFFEALFAAGKDARALSGLRVAAVGRATAEALRGYGIAADLVPGSYSGAAMAEAILASGVRAGARVLLARPRKALPELPEKLRAAGVEAEELFVYETAPLPMERLDPAPFAWVCFTSPSCVERFAAACREGGKELPAGLKALCIGESTAGAARAAGLETFVSAEATLDGMAETLLRLNTERLER